MNNKELLSVALKVFAIYVLVQLLVGIPSMYRVYLAARNMGGVYEMPLIPLLLVLGTYVAVFFLFRLIWKLSNSVVASVTANTEENTANLSTDLPELLIMVVGLFVTIEAVFAATTPIYAAFWEILSHEGSGGLRGDTVVWVLSEALKAVLGFTLIITPKGWIGVIRRLRTIGREA